MKPNNSTLLACFFTLSLVGCFSQPLPSPVTTNREAPTVVQVATNAQDLAPQRASFTAAWHGLFVGVR